MGVDDWTTITEVKLPSGVVYFLWCATSRLCTLSASVTGDRIEVFLFRHTYAKRLDVGRVKSRLTDSLVANGQREERFILELLALDEGELQRQLDAGFANTFGV